MNSRERIAAVCNREKADRPATGLRCTPEVWEALKKDFKVKTREEVLDELDIDLRFVSVPFIGPKNRSTPSMGGEGRDFWGIDWIEAKNEFNTYYEISTSPLEIAESIIDIKNHDWPSLDWWDYDAINEIMEKHNQKEERSMLFFAGGAFETPWYIRGFERFLMDLYEYPDIVAEICSTVADFYLKRAQRMIEAANGRIDVIGSGGDIGSERGMMLNPDLWRKHIKPHTKTLIKSFKDMGLNTFYHSCGSLVPVINDLIEIGLDILEPIQVTAAGMNPENLYEKFGDRLSFHGAIDEVHLLPHATPEQVYDETTRTID